MFHSLQRVSSVTPAREPRALPGKLPGLSRRAVLLSGLLAGGFAYFRLILFRQSVEIGALAHLQHAEVGGDHPAVFRRHLIRVARHRAKAVGHHVIEMARRSLPQTV